MPKQVRRAAVSEMKNSEKIVGGTTIRAEQTLDSNILYKKPADWSKIWFYIVNMVNYIEYKQLKKGQGFFRYGQIAESCTVSKTQINHCIKYLKAMKKITTQKKTRGLVITILNWDAYQDL